MNSFIDLEPLGCGLGSALLSQNERVKAAPITILVCGSEEHNPGELT